MPTDDSRWEESLRRCNEEDYGNAADVGIRSSGANRRKSLSYHRLPEPLLKLTILKLDGSAFDVSITSAATVLDLKTAVKDLFTHLPKEEGAQISWSHVWSHFCLSYQGLRLNDDNDTLRNLRLKDGDQLCFVRHLSLNKSPIMRQTKNHLTSSRTHKRSMTAPEVLQRIEENRISMSGTKVAIIQYADEKYSNVEANEALVVRKKSKWSRFLLKFLACARFQNSSRVAQGNCRSLRWATSY